MKKIEKYIFHLGSPIHGVSAKTVLPKFDIAWNGQQHVLKHGKYFVEGMLQPCYSDVSNWVKEEEGKYSLEQDTIQVELVDGKLMDAFVHKLQNSYDSQHKVEHSRAENTKRVR